MKNKSGEPALFYSTADSAERSACFDFSNPEFLAWYKPRVMKVLHMGVGVIKTDFSEAVPEDAVYYDGRDGVEGHNRLTYLYAETIYRWMEEYKKEQAKKLREEGKGILKRPFRAVFFGESERGGRDKSFAAESLWKS